MSGGPAPDWSEARDYHVAVRIIRAAAILKRSGWEELPGAIGMGIDL